MVSQMTFLNFQMNLFDLINYETKIIRSNIKHNFLCTFDKFN